MTASSFVRLVKNTPYWIITSSGDDDEIGIFFFDHMDGMISFIEDNEVSMGEVGRKSNIVAQSVPDDVLFTISPEIQEDDSYGK